MTEKTGTFVVTEADEGSAVLRDVDDGQVHTLSANLPLDPREGEEGSEASPLVAGEALEATVVAEPPMELTWAVEAVERRWQVELVDSDLEPTRQARETAGDQPMGDLSRLERAGSGEVHVLTAPDPTAAAADVLDDEGTVERAARLGATRVEVRTGEGMLSVRYLPD